MVGGEGGGGEVLNPRGLQGLPGGGPELAALLCRAGGRSVFLPWAVNHPNTHSLISTTTNTKSP